MQTTYSPSISKIGTTCPTPRADRGKDSTLPTREEVLKKLKMLEIDSSFVKEPSRNRDTRPSGRAQSRQVSMRSPRESFYSRRGGRTQSQTCVGFHCGTLRGEIPPACPPPAPKMPMPSGSAQRARCCGTRFFGLTRLNHRARHIQAGPARHLRGFLPYLKFGESCTIPSTLVTFPRSGNSRLSSCCRDVRSCRRQSVRQRLA